MLYSQTMASLRDRDSLRKEDKMPIPKVSFVRRLDCIRPLTNQKKTLRIESPLSEKHPWTTVTLESSLFAFTRSPHVSLLFDLILPHRPFQAASFSLRLVRLPVVSVHCLVYCPSPVMKRKNVFSSGRTASRDLRPSRHRQTDR